MSGYNAASIRVLRDEEVVWEFEWAQAAALAEQYRRDARWIQRGLEACTVAGVAPGYFIRRYLDGDRSIPKHGGVEAAFIERMRSGTR